jgi:pimeloyl-ACP methyl ester carboxylesterase
MDIISELYKLARLKMVADGARSYMVKTHIANQHVYDIKGKGSLPPVVFLHGIGTSTIAYRRVIAILQRFSRRILAPDAPGHGFSEEPFVPVNADAIYEGVESVINSEMAEPAIVFGNSMGGALALKYALENPDRVLGLVLNSPGGAQMDSAALKQFLKPFRIKNRSDAVNFVNALTYKPSFLSFLVSGHVLANFEKPVVQQLLDNVETNLLAFTPEELQRLKMPILLIWGKAERIMLENQFEFFKKYLPEQTIIQQPEDFGHCPFIDRPVALAARIIDFAEQLV